MLTDTMTQDHEYIIQLNTLTDDCTRAAVPARQMFTAERAFIYTSSISFHISVGGSQRNYNSRDGDDDEDENDDETEEEEALDPSRRREDPLTRVSLKARLLTSAAPGGPSLSSSPPLLFTEESDKS